MGALAGLAVTVVVTYLWPRRINRHLGAITGALVGLAVAYVIMTQVDI